MYDHFIVIRVDLSCARCGTLSLDSLVGIFGRIRLTSVRSCANCLFTQFGQQYLTWILLLLEMSAFTLNLNIFKSFIFSVRVRNVYCLNKPRDLMLVSNWSEWPVDVPFWFLGRIRWTSGRTSVNIFLKLFCRYLENELT